MADGMTGFFGGFAHGTRTRQELEMKREELNARITQRRNEQQQKLIQRYKDIGNTLYEAMLEPDEATRNTVIDAIAAEVETLRGKPLNKTFVNWMRKNPEDGAMVLENSAKQGISPSVLFELQDDPILLSQGLLAMGKAKREREARRVRGDGGGTAPTTPDPSQQGGGSGLRLSPTPMSVNDAPMDVSAPGGMQGSPSPTNDVSTRIGSLTRRIDALRSMGRPEPEIKSLVDERNMLEEQKFKLTSAGPIKAAQREEEVVPLEELREAAANGARGLRPGMTRREFNQIVPSTRPVSGPNDVRGEPISAPTSGLKTASAPLAGGAASSVGVRTPSQVTTDTERAQRRERPLPTELLRDPDVQRLGLSTYGQYDDAVAKGQLKVKTQAQLDTESERTKNVERVAGKAWEDIRKEGEAARTRFQTYETLKTALAGAGPTGRLIGPARQIFMQVAQAFGAKPEALASIETAEAATLHLATQVLRDFSGPDSDRDFLRALEQSPGIRKVKGANAALIAIAQAEDLRRQEKAANANKWVAEFHSLTAKDPATGKTFDQFWVEYIRSQGPLITESVLSKLGLKPSQVWKQSRNDPGRTGP